MTDNRWYSVLDDLDAHLLTQEEAFSVGQAELIVAFEVPPGLGALPPNLGPRFALLARRSDALLHAVEHCALHQGHLELTRQLLGYSPAGEQ